MSKKEILCYFVSICYLLKPWELHFQNFFHWLYLKKPEIMSSVSIFYRDLLEQRVLKADKVKKVQR